MTTDGAGSPDDRPVPHAASSDAIAALDQRDTAGALASGKVTMISLEAICGRLGPRWAGKRVLVHEHLERDLDRTLGALGFYQRISDTDYLVAQADKSQLAGQIACLHCLRHTLHHFLGEALIKDMLLHTVSRVGAEGVFGAKLDVMAVQQAIGQAAGRGAADDEDGEGDEEGSQGLTTSWSPFIASNGARVRVSCSLEPVFQLKTSSRIGHRLVRRVVATRGQTALSPDDVRRLSSFDIERIDFATIERGLDRLKADGAARGLSLILPVSFVTLSSARARSTLIDLFKTAKDAVQLGLICEVCDIEGVPPSALLSAVSLIRPYSLYVFGHLQETPASGLPWLKGSGLQGLSMECPDTVTEDADFFGWAQSTRAAASAAGKAALAYRLPSLRHAAMASFMGATHGSLRSA